jgi:hypothetical protein
MLGAELLAASFTVNSGSMVSVFVSAGAKSGQIRVTTAGETATRAHLSFTVLL